MASNSVCLCVQLCLSLFIHEMEDGNGNCSASFWVRIYFSLANIEKNVMLMGNVINLFHCSLIKEICGQVFSSNYYYIRHYNRIFSNLSSVILNLIAAHNLPCSKLGFLGQS